MNCKIVMFKVEKQVSFLARLSRAEISSLSIFQKLCVLVFGWWVLTSHL